MILARWENAQITFRIWREKKERGKNMFWRLARKMSLRPGCCDDLFHLLTAQRQVHKLYGVLAEHSEIFKTKFILQVIFSFLYPYYF